jgi:hypothetical protein
MEKELSTKDKTYNYTAHPWQEYRKRVLLRELLAYFPTMERYRPGRS